MFYNNILVIELKYATNNIRGLIFKEKWPNLYLFLFIYNLYMVKELYLLTILN